jgi:hypothetical protein
MSGLPSLETICVAQVAQNIVTGTGSKDPESLWILPLDIVLRLFALVLQRGALTPKIVELFAQSGHDTVLDVIKVRTKHLGAQLCSTRGMLTTLLPLQDLNLREPPPVLLADTPNSWLGERRLS